MADFNARNKSLTAKLLQQGYRYHKLRKTFSKFYRQHYELVSKFNVGLKTLLHQGLSEPEIYGDLVYEFKKKKLLVGLIFLISSEKLSFVTIGYNINIMRQSACLVFFFFFFFASLFNCTQVSQCQTQLWPRHKAIFVYCLAHRGSTVGFLLLQCSSGVVRHPMDLQVSVATRFCRVLIFASSQYLSVFYLFHVMIHWWVRKPSRGPNNCMFCAMIEAEGEVGYP